MFLKANDFRLKSLINQSKDVEAKIEEASHRPSPIVRFDYPFYEEVIKDLENDGWAVYDVKDKNNVIIGQLICPDGFMEDIYRNSDEDIPEDIY